MAPSELWGALGAAWTAQGRRPAADGIARRIAGRGGRCEPGKLEDWLRLVDPHRT